MERYENKPMRKKGKKILRSILSSKLTPFSLRKKTFLHGRSGIQVMDPYLWIAKAITGKLD